VKVKLVSFYLEFSERLFHPFQRCPKILLLFLDEGGQLFRFMDGRDGPPRYSILSVAQEGASNHMWKVVGNFSCKLKLSNPFLFYKKTHCSIVGGKSTAESGRVGAAVFGHGRPIPVHAELQRAPDSGERGMSFLFGFPIY
jgi:hypothetical protein